MHRFLRATTAVVVGGLVLAGSAATAGADPEQGVGDLHCGDAHYVISTAGNGEFTPGHDLGSTTVFVPVVFGDFTGTLTDESGAVIDSFTEVGTVHKGSSHPRGRTIVHCTYLFEESFVAGPDDEGLVAGETYTFSGSGEVTGFATGRR